MLDLKKKLAVAAVSSFIALGGNAVMAEDNANNPLDLTQEELTAITLLQGYFLCRVEKASLFSQSEFDAAVQDKLDIIRRGVAEKHPSATEEEITRYMEEDLFSRSGMVKAAVRETLSRKFSLECFQEQGITKEDFDTAAGVVNESDKAGEMVRTYIEPLPKVRM